MRVVHLEPRAPGAPSLYELVAAADPVDSLRAVSVIERERAAFSALVREVGSVVVDPTLHAFDEDQIGSLDRIHLSLDEPGALTLSTPINPPPPSLPAGFSRHGSIRLEDRCLREIDGVSADICVALPSLDTASTIGGVLRSAVEGVRRFFPGSRALFVNTDSGSADDTQQAFRAVGDELAARHPEYAFVSTLQQGIRPGKGVGVRTGMTIAHTVGTRAYLALDTDIENPDPTWVSALLGPILEGSAWFTLPMSPQHKDVGDISRVLLTPLVAALYGPVVFRPLSGRTAYSGEAVAELLGPEHDWSGRVTQYGVEISIVTHAAAHSWPTAQPRIGQVLHPSRNFPSMAQMVGQVTQTLFRRIVDTSSAWLERSETYVPPVVPGTRVDGPLIAPPDPRGLGGIRAWIAQLWQENRPIYRRALSDETRVRLSHAIASAVKDDLPDFPDELWARVVYEFALAYRRGVAGEVGEEAFGLAMMAPLLAQSVTFFCHASGFDSAADLLAAKRAAFVAEKPRFVDQWRAIEYAAEETG
ncbi:MAG TPA: hypothetical protein VI076_06195 [Actinopolymorphaceae bacterium]